MMFLTVALVQLLALMSPGPDFLLVCKIAVSCSRKQAVMAGLGITLGVMWWAAITLLGLHLMSEQLHWLYQLITLAGGAYLCWLGYNMLRDALRRQHSPAPMQYREQQRAERHFIKGLLTNLSNPKVIIYFASIFSLFIADDISGTQRLELFILIVAETIVWFLLVACLFSLPVIQRGYQRLAGWIDGSAGVLFIGFGLRLIIYR